MVNYEEEINNLMNKLAEAEEENNLLSNTIDSIVKESKRLKFQLGNPPKIAIYGLGVVGRAILHHRSWIVEKYCIDPNPEIKDVYIAFEKAVPFDEISFVHVCFDCTSDSDKFIQEINRIAVLYRFAVILVHSTISPQIADKMRENSKGKMRELYKRIVHMPVRLNHVNAIQDIVRFKLCFTCSYETVESVINYMTRGNIFTVEYYGTDYRITCFAKLFSVWNFHWQIAFSQLVRTVCDKYDIPFSLVYNDFLGSDEICQSYQQLDKQGNSVGSNIMKRILCFPGVIGGHCVMQDNELLAQEDLCKPIAEILEDLNKSMKEKTQ